MASSLLCSAEASVLVVIDLQIKLLAAMAEADRAAVVKSAETMLTAASALEVAVIYTEQHPKGLGPTVPALMERMPAAAQGVEKTAFSCQAHEGFRAALNRTGRRQVILVGQEAHVCVLQTAMELVDAGFEVFVIEEAVCSRSTAHRQNALQRMRGAGVIITNVESVLFEWLRDAAHSEFKTLANLIR
jgi:nicotinamidase-related amidase